jgi:hypothetical protein
MILGIPFQFTIFVFFFSSHGPWFTRLIHQFRENCIVNADAQRMWINSLALVLYVSLLAIYSLYMLAFVDQLREASSTLLIGYSIMYFIGSLARIPFLLCFMIICEVLSQRTNNLIFQIMSGKFTTVDKIAETYFALFRTFRHARKFHSFILLSWLIEFLVIAAFNLCIIYFQAFGSDDQKIASNAGVPFDSPLFIMTMLYMLMYGFCWMRSLSNLNERFAILSFFIFVSCPYLIWIASFLQTRVPQTCFGSL